MSRCRGLPARAARAAVVVLGTLSAAPYVVASSAAAQEVIVTADTTPAEAEPFFTSRDGWVALGFVAATVALAPLDLTLANALRDSSLHVHRSLRNTAAGLRFLGFPGTLLIGTSLYALGSATGEPLVAEVGVHGAQAVALSWAFVWTGKNLIGRARPEQNPDEPFDLGFGRGFRRGSEYVSFPSGHSAAAFAFAAVLAEETRHHWRDAYPFIAPAAYGTAMLVGVSRMYHNRHWATDVLVGAGIGVFSGLKLVQYHHRNPDNLLERILLPRAGTADGSTLLLVWRLPVHPP